MKRKMESECKTNICEIATLKKLKGVAIKSFEKNTLELKDTMKLKKKLELIKELPKNELFLPIISVKENENKITMKMPLMNFDLFSLFDSNPLFFNHRNVSLIMLQLFKAVKMLHHNGFIHGDIKLENILIDFSSICSSEGFQIVLSDFMLVEKVNPFKKKLYKKIKGSKGYIHPSLFSKNELFPFQKDVWSLSVLLFILLKGFYPFCQSNVSLYSKQTQDFQHITQITSSLPESQNFKKICLESFAKKGDLQIEYLKNLILV